MTAKTRLEPPTSEVTEHFWEATKQERYLVQWCDACTAPVFYPRAVCPQCLSAAHLTWRESKGTGTVHAVSVQHRPANPKMADKVPYAVALVDLDAGGRSSAKGGDEGSAPSGDGPTIRVMSNVVNCDPSAIQVGDAVTVTWEPLSDGRNVPLFQPADRPKEA